MAEETAAAVARRAPSLLRDYAILVKPGIMLALLISCYTAMIVASGGFPPLQLSIATLLGGAMGGIL